MNKKKSYSLVMFVTCIVLGIIISIQFKQDVEENPIITLSSIQQLENEVNNTKIEIKNLEEAIAKSQEELDNIKEAINKGNVSQILNQQLYDMKIISGFTDLQGPGIIISIDDNNENYYPGNNVMDDIVHDIDILNIINDLKVAGAEGISIKGQRVLASSEIHCGGPIIWVNKRSVTTPFVIKAIGDPKMLHAAVSAPNTYGDILKNDYKIKITTKISDNVFIPKHWDIPQYKYAKCVKEGE